MKHDSLQLMVHARDIADLQPEIDYPGVRITGTEKTSNPNYLWVNLHISGEAKPGTFPINFKDGRRTRLKYEYELKARAAGSAERQGYDASDVIYLITPDRFANGNPENDTAGELGDNLNRDLPLTRHGGDIQGIIDHLDYLEEMAFTAIWLNPVLENEQPEYSYHGYSTTDFYQVDPRFGDNEKYLELAEKAGEKDIILIKDVILNHIGDGHWWIRDLPDSNWLNFQDAYKITTHVREALQDPYASEYDAKMHSQGWFVPSMPDMNQKHPLLATYLIQNNIWWIENAGLRGIRVDTYSYPDKDFLTDWTRRVMEEYPNFNIVGEEWSNNPAIVAYWQRDKNPSDGYMSYLPGLMDFPLQTALVNSLKGNQYGLMGLYHALVNDFLYPHPMDLVVFADNHDMSRIYTQLDEDYDLYKMAMAYLLTTRGIPQVYYGTEILMKNPGTDDHGVIRSDFPGGWEGDEANAFTGNGLEEQAKEAQDYMRKLLNWRKDTEAIHTGELKHFAPREGVYVYFRYTDDQKVMVVMNPGESRQLALETYQEELANVRKAKDVVSEEIFDLSAESITLPAKTVLVLEVE